MKTSITTLLILFAYFTTAIADPAAPSLSGIWKTGGGSLLSPEVVLILNKDGSAEMPPMPKVRWKRKAENLVLESPRGEIAIKILALTSTTLVLQGADGKVESYTRVADAK